MVQSFNWEGIKYTALGMFRPSLLLPQMKVKNVSCIEFEKLYEKGIRGVIFDKDNCLTAPYLKSIHPSIEPGWLRCKKHFTADRIAILSNSAGTPDDKNNSHATEVSESLGVHVIQHEIKKPGGGDEIRAFVAKNWKLELKQVAMVGDRVITDVVFGNLNGMYTIWTNEIISEKDDNPVAAKIRTLEYAIIAGLEKLRVQPPPLPTKTSHGVRPEQLRIFL
ncbi:hypothetical protein DSO57_1014341 [Entomophthora muscae]|uniref:Uncharacterized protein n=1 Tax=Entomophthora muscae TaxID=34485 RepID=A0ACC2T5H7_9FUNG|nr:hypothetical protein DSO57_1014341 [Entomophthora muscae]